jgi:hypothetical protein
MSVAGIPGCTIPYSFYFLLPDLHSVLEERSVYYRETKNGLYSTLPFVLANTLVNMPFLFICTLLFTLISYWAIVRLLPETESELLTDGSARFRACIPAAKLSSASWRSSTSRSSQPRVKWSSSRP